MKYVFSFIACFFALHSFAQHDGHSPDMDSSMNMQDNDYLPRIISHAIIKSWGSSNLFKTKLDPSALVYLTGEQEHTITIKAFQHRFYDDPAVLKPVWVLGYVANESTKQPALPGPVITAEYAHPTKIFWVNKVYESLQNVANYGLYPTYDSQAKAHPFVPIIYNVNDPLHAPMIADALYPDFRQFPNGVDPMHEKYMDMSTYYSTTVHMHGANVAWQNDGYPTSKYYPTPGAAPVNITWGLFGKFEQNKTGQHYAYSNVFPEGAFNLIKSKLASVPFVENDSTKYEGHHGGILWYHDHAMMRTATNVYAGMAGMHIVKGDDEKTFSSGIKYAQDVPLILEDKSFTESNYLYYNTTQSKFANNTAPEAEGQPEFLGNTITVNGKIWPYMNVDKCIYRFRILNASNARFYRIALAKWKNGKIDTTDNAKLSRNFIQVGTEAGFFPDGKFPQIGNDSSTLTLAPAERADVLINFSAFEPGTSLVLLNYAPDAPFGNDELTPMNEDGTFDDLTNYVMLFRIGDHTAAASVANEAALAARLHAFASSPVYKKTTSSQQLYSYYNSSYQFKTGLQKALQSAYDNGTAAEFKHTNALSAMFPKEAILFDSADVFRLNISEAANYQQMPEPYRKFADQNPMLQSELAFPMAFLNETEWNVEGRTADTSAARANAAAQYEKVVNNYATEIWAIWNNTDDAHPIHIHLNRFRILGRQKVDDSGHPVPGVQSFSLPEPNEMAWKDVVRTKPRYITYLLHQYILNDSSQEGQFVYHCHILEHEDMSMMRRLIVKPVDALPKFVLQAY